MENIYALSEELTIPIETIIADIIMDGRDYPVAYSGERSRLQRKECVPPRIGVRDDISPVVRNDPEIGPEIRYGILIDIDRIEPEAGGLSGCHHREVRRRITPFESETGMLCRDRETPDEQLPLLRHDLQILRHEVSALQEILIELE
jgi:hypothetical protein